MKTKPGFNIRNVCGQNLIVGEGEENIDFSSIISMNETSTYLWKAVQKMDNFTVEDMVDLLQKEYEVDHDTAFNDCERLAAQWGKTGIIEGNDIPQIEVEDTVVDVDGSKPIPNDTLKETPHPQKHSFLGKLFHKK